MGPARADRAQVGWANDRGIKSSARAGFPQRPVFRRRRSRTGALHRRHRIPRQCADRYPAPYGPPPRQGRNARDVECGARPLFRTALRGADPGHRRRQGSRLYPRVLPQEHQSAHGAVRHRRLLHAARRQDQPYQGSHRHFRPGPAAARARYRRDPDRQAAGSDLASSSFRGDAKHRTMVRNCAPENLEIPRCAIAHLRFASSMRPGMTSGYFRAPLNLVAPAVTHHKAVSGHIERMKIALLALLGLALGGAALGIGAGLAWVEIFKTTSFEGYSGMLVFFTFMPLGAAIGGIGGALLFGIIAIRDAEIAIEREPVRRHDR